MLFFSVLRSQSQKYLGPGAGAEIKILINIFCSQFGGCYDEDKLISTSISNSLKCQYMAVAGAGAGIMVKVGAGAENK